MTDPIITARDLVKRFGKNTALDGVSLNVEKGTVLGLLGPNGAGKTTAIRVLTTLIKPDSGHASVGGFDVATESQRVRSLIGLAGQYAAVDEVLTGRENLELFGLWYHLPKKEYRLRAQEMLERLSLTDAADRQVKTYSGGMRRRLDVGASLIADPPIMFLDEPTTGLDPRSRNELWQFIRERVEAGTTVLLTTQYMEEAEHLANRIVVINKGKLIADGTADQLKRQTGGSTLEIRVADRRDVGRAAALLAEAGVAAPRTDPEQGLVSIPAARGVDLLLETGRRLKEARIAVDDLGTRRPTLDEVFLALTGGETPNHPDSPDDPGSPGDPGPLSHAASEPEGTR
ncbi:ATP-binding cassette domain-containing protein [Dactylosporangium roseum]|uniref:ATP-binding cassette domain-containing protein n=1 Tax=Dactylosporangium roseum TaxID=47989 RepID=A0ABY5ZB14_9ACTN|nr:ATP-binding cassette domain-containing protein [Dactylosporangium roseum]UWZ39295.1 ATP-binding cassette domain-containing protein [Dactylosporangium roseum]